MGHLLNMSKNRLYFGSSKMSKVNLQDNWKYKLEIETFNHRHAWALQEEIQKAQSHFDLY